MAIISLVASGTRGDVQPYIALGQGLLSAGFEVRLLTNDNFEELVTGAGLLFSSTGPSIEDIVNSDEWRELLESSNFLRILSQQRREMKRFAAGVAAKMPALLRGSDLIVAGMSGMGGVLPIAHHYSIPIVMAYVVPFTPTQEFPAPLLPRLPAGGIVNKWSFNLMHQLFWQSSKEMDVQIRQALGLSGGSFFGPFREMRERRIPTLYGFSRHALPQPADWPGTHKVTGYWFAQEPDHWQPPAEVLDFLDAGDPPVYVGFGSMGSRNAEEAGELVLGALQMSGQRAILASGWGGLKPADLPESVRLITQLPHSWLFPRTAAVVHHGGAGTTAAGFRAGVPSIVVPFMGDQPFWAQRAADLGVGPAPIPRKKLTVHRLAQSLEQALGSAPIRQAAARLGEAIRAEDGVRTAAQLVERFMKQPPN
jgi:sterol 3beta-glucosyltransferase